MKIWAHRGCSQRYPENTLLAFEKAAAIQNLEGIELDIQLTKDGELVVIHDERVDRTTEGMGFVRDYKLSELKRLHIYADNHPSQSIPTIDEVFDLLETRLKSGLKLNIELKNSVYVYNDMEEKIVEKVHQRGLQKAVVYSTFYAKSLEKVGITIGDDKKLTVDEEKFKAADISKVKSLFNETPSFAASVSSQASFINSAASREAAKANTYNQKGSYNNNYLTGDLFSAMF